MRKQQQRSSRYSATAYVRRGSAAEASQHEHDWQSYPADSRYERCPSCGQARKAPVKAAVSIPCITTDLGLDIDIGARVRIDAHSEPAYSRTYWGKVGVVVGTTTSKWGIKRCLVDYSEYGRYQVRAEHLERAEVQP